MQASHRATIRSRTTQKLVMSAVSELTPELQARKRRSVTTLSQPYN